MNYNYNDTRYNNKTYGSGKHKKNSGSVKLVKASIGALAIFMLTGFAAKYSETDMQMAEEEGISVTQNYSPSGGIDTVYHGERQHNVLDVIERMYDDIKLRIDMFEDKYSEGDDIDESMSRG